MKKLDFFDEDGEKVEFYCLEETRLGGKNYLLVTDSEEDEDGECYILVDTSVDGDDEAKYSFVEDDEELEAVGKVFAALLEDDDTELEMR